MRKIVFFLMSQKGYESLQHFIDVFGRSPISFVVGARDEHIQKDYYDEIKQVCVKNEIVFFDRKDAFTVDTDYMIAISWRWLISQDRARLIVMHDSLLPRYRGFAPLVNCLVNGEPEIGVTALFASDEYDRGDIIAQRSIPVTYPIKISEAIHRVSFCYKWLIEEVGKNITSGQVIRAEKQDETQASYSLWLDDNDYMINWNRDAAFIKRFIDAVGFPYSGASALMGDKKVRVLEAMVLDDLKVENRSPGKIIFVQDGKPVVVCGKGLLKIISMTDDTSTQEILPLKRFRVKFT